MHPAYGELVTQSGLLKLLLNIAEFWIAIAQHQCIQQRVLSGLFGVKTIGQCMPGLVSQPVNNREFAR